MDEIYTQFFFNIACWELSKVSLDWKVWGFCILPTYSWILENISVYISSTVGEEFPETQNIDIFDW